MFVHHVFFWMNNPDAAADEEKLAEGLNSLKDIKAIRMAHVGVPASTNREVIERGYAFSLLLVFDSLEEHDNYQVDPIHEAFVHNYKHLWSKVVIYDSEDV